jgi:nitroreductase
MIMTNVVLDAIENRRATNIYDSSRNIGDAQISEMVRLATRAPTAFHLQNWRFIAVKTPEGKVRLRKLAFDQPKVAGDGMDLHRWISGVEALTFNSAGLRRSPTNPRARLKSPANLSKIDRRAIEALRSLIEEVRLIPENGRLEIELMSDLPAMLAFANGTPRRADPAGRATMVAGEGFEPPTLGL